MKIDARSQRAMLWTGVAMCVVYTLSFVFLCEFWPLPQPTMDASQVLELYTRHNIQTRIGAVMMAVTGCFYLPWAIVVCAQMYRVEHGFPIWTIMSGLASTLGAWLFAIPAIVWGIAGFTVERDPQITLFAHQVGFLLFVAPISFFPMQLVPISVVSLSPRNTDPHTALPRWFGWFTLWTAVLASTGQMSMLFKTGPFAWNGILSFFLPVYVFSAWVIALMYCMLRAIKLQEDAPAYIDDSASKPLSGATR